MKGRAPVSTEVLKVKLPRPAEADLPNGLHVMVLEDRRLPQVSFQILIPGAGGYFDPADLPGLAVVTAAMMREGTASRTTQQISELLETKAATVAVTSGLSTTNATVSGSSLTENFEDDVRAGGRHPAQPVLSAGRARSLSHAHARRPRPAAHEPGLPRQRDDVEDPVRCASRVARLAHRRGADEDHARRAGLGVTARASCPITRSSPSRATSRWPTRAR